MTASLSMPFRVDFRDILAVYLIHFIELYFSQVWFSKLNASSTLYLNCKAVHNFTNIVDLLQKYQRILQ